MEKKNLYSLYNKIYQFQPIYLSFLADLNKSFENKKKFLPLFLISIRI